MSEFNDNLIGRVEDFLKQNKREKVGFIFNPYKTRENDITPHDLASQLQGGITNALTSDYADTLEALDRVDRRSYVYAAGKFLRRHIFLKWDGVVPTPDQFEAEAVDETVAQSRAKTYPYQLSLALLGYSANLERLKATTEGKTLKPVWPDRAEFQMINRANNEDTHMCIIINNPHDQETSSSARLGWFKESASNVADPGDIESTVYGIEQANSGIDRQNTLYRDYFMMRNILMFGTLDLKSTIKAREYLLNNCFANEINDWKSAELSSAYFLAAIDKLFPEIGKAVRSAHAHQREYGS